MAHHRGHLFGVIEQEPVEENLVGVLQSAQLDVALQVVVLAVTGLVGANHLVVEGLDMGRQAPVQAEAAPFLLLERGALVEFTKARVTAVPPARVRAQYGKPSIVRAYPTPPLSALRQRDVTGLPQGVWERSGNWPRSCS